MKTLRRIGVLFVLAFVLLGASVPAAAFADDGVPIIPPPQEPPPGEGG